MLLGWFALANLVYALGRWIASVGASRSVTFGFGLLNVPGIVMSIFVGLLLILVIAAPIVYRRIKYGRG